MGGVPFSYTQAMAWRSGRKRMLALGVCLLVVAASLWFGPYIWKQAGSTKVNTLMTALNTLISLIGLVLTAVALTPRQQAEPSAKHEERRLLKSMSLSQQELLLLKLAHESKDK